MNIRTSTTGNKFQEIRELMGLPRNRMELILSLPERALERIEKQGNKVSFDYIQTLLHEFPEFTYWITLGITDIDAGQIDPKLYQGYLIASEKKELFDWKNSKHIDYLKKSIEFGLDKLIATSSLQLKINAKNDKEFLKQWRVLKPSHSIKKQSENLSFANIKAWGDKLESGEITEEQYFKHMGIKYPPN